jgi:hypothetical protein
MREPAAAFQSTAESCRNTRIPDSRKSCIRKRLLTAVRLLFTCTSLLRAELRMEDIKVYKSDNGMDIQLLDDHRSRLPIVLFM